MKSPIRRERDKKRTIAEPSSNVLSVYNAPNWEHDNRELDKGYEKGEHGITNKGTAPTEKLDVSVYEYGGGGSYDTDSYRRNSPVQIGGGTSDSPLKAIQKAYNSGSDEVVKQTSTKPSLGTGVKVPQNLRIFHAGVPWKDEKSTIRVSSNPVRVTPSQFDGN